MADYNETLRALRRDAAELERIAGGTGAYWTGAAAENFRRQFTAQTCQLDLLDNKKTLYKTIENLWLAANSAQQQYVAASQKLKSTETSYSLVSEQFNVGMKNTVELLTEKNNLLSAQQETLQAKYTAILNAGLLRFYQGEEINLF